MVKRKDEVPESDDTTDRWLWRTFLSKGKFVPPDTAVLPHKISDINPASRDELESGGEGKHDTQEELRSLMR
jgi:hypothetical protein